MRGISTRTTSLVFHVMRLHYSADPDKDPATETGRQWYEQAQTGMSDVAGHKPGRRNGREILVLA
jgi:hypothetical protein